MLKKVILFLLEVKRNRIKKEISKKKEEMECSIRLHKITLRNEISKLDSDMTKINSAIRTIKTIEDYLISH